MTLTSHTSIPLAPAPILLITGITGFFAAHVLDAALADPKGYRVRGTTRDVGKRDALLARLSAQDAARVELVRVDDLVSGDFTEALQDVSFVAHVASPCTVMYDDAERDLLQPAIDGTLNVLRAAAKQPTVKRVAVTSSLAAVVDFFVDPLLPGRTLTKHDWTPYGRKDAVGPSAYVVAKTMAEQAAYNFVQTERPSFSLATFNPSLLYGAILQPVKRMLDVNATSGLILALISSLDNTPDFLLPFFCHARDAADAHVRWLSSDTSPSTGRYLLSAGVLTYPMAIKFIAENYPHLIARLPKDHEAILADKGKFNKEFCAVDCSEAENDLGIRFRDWQTSLKDTVDSLLELEKHL